MIILIPCKRLSAGKSRLSPCLNDKERQTLCESLLARTVELAAGFVGPDLIRVITADPDAIAIATRYLVSTIPDPTSELNSALEHARSRLALEGLSNRSLMVLPIDLPFATRASLTAAGDNPADIVIAADESGTGTNLLLLRGGAWEFPFRFGPDSYSQHVSQAQLSGLTFVSLADWRLARDIDSPDQYFAWRGRQFPHRE